jgi:hypothetical protein
MFFTPLYQQDLSSDFTYKMCLMCITYVGLATGRWFSPGTPVSSTNNTDRHDIAEILLKVALNIGCIAKTVIYYLAFQHFAFAKSIETSNRLRTTLQNPTRNFRIRV